MQWGPAESGAPAEAVKLLEMPVVLRGRAGEAEFCGAAKLRDQGMG